MALISFIDPSVLGYCWWGGRRTHGLYKASVCRDGQITHLSVIELQITWK